MGIDDQTAYQCKAGAATFWGVQAMRVSNVTMVECSDYGTTFNKAGGDERLNNSILIENSHYIQYARPDCTACYVKNE